MKISVKLSLFFILAMLLGTPAFATSTFSTHPENDANSNLAPVLKRTLPAVVNIRADIKITDPTILYQITKTAWC